MDQVFIIGFIAVVASVSAYFQLLKPSGAIAAFLTGVFIWAGFGIKGLILLGVFFLTSSLLSKYKSHRKQQLSELHQKGAARDWAQVAANGGTAALAGIGNFLLPDPIWTIVLASSLASANGDTWASELGVLSKVQPLSVKSFKRVPTGTSGAISAVGTAAAAVGSLLIALTAASLFPLGPGWTGIIFLLGVVGTMIDTFLGAYLQAEFACVTCNRLTEKTIHCSLPTRHVSGIVKLDNDAVNFLSCFTAALAGIVLYIIF
ncbi:hypothetical protein UB32_09145 [Mesobacillus subterraneus]|uniref:DUF92 domain-containing protein n=1 Tax=Mesobacillus subterraneus TaxID=285983 RepID=A0A0D6ZCN0_9BACI|nr:hypothetical protein UB32_09145 [Mesobacillus subterraneus]